MTRAWFYLSLAIVAEVSSVVVMKLISQEGSWGGLLFMYLMVGLSFTCMAFALKKISLAVAYATWESLGLLAVAAIGALCFSEHLSVLQLIAIALLLGGVTLVNIAENEHGE